MRKKLWIPAIVLAILLSQFGIALAVIEWRGEAGPPGLLGERGLVGPQGSAAAASSCQAEMYDRLIKDPSMRERAVGIAATTCRESRGSINRPD